VFYFDTCQLKTPLSDSSADSGCGASLAAIRSTKIARARFLFPESAQGALDICYSCTARGSGREIKTCTNEKDCVCFRNRARRPEGDRDDEKCQLALVMIF